MGILFTIHIGILFTIHMGILLTTTMGILLTIVPGIQFTISTIESTPTRENKIPSILAKSPGSCP